MAQLSRPYQIALAATVFLALVWFVAFRPHSTSSSSTPVVNTPASAPAALGGLSRAVNHAHGAVAASQKQADKSASASAETSSQSPGAGSQSVTATHSKQAGTAGSTAARTTKSTTVIHPKHAVPAGTITTSKSSVTVTKSRLGGASKSTTVTVTKHSVHAAPAQQVAVEKQLKQHKVVLVLFWNPKGSDDVAVHKELQAVEKQQGGKVAVHYALAKQVGSFGSITKAIQVYQTPTILMVNGKGLTTTLTGFTDAFSIEQTINEARAA